MRIKIIRLIIIGLFVMIALDLIYIQAVRGRYFYNLSANNRIRVVPLEGGRGRIKDRYERVLADTRTAYHVMVIPQDVNDEQGLFRFLSGVLGVDQEKIERRYRQRKYAPFAPVIVVEDIDRHKAIVLEENKYLFPSLIIQEGYKRFYPLGENSAHVLGYVGKINRARKERFKEYGYSPQSSIGYSGVEEFYDAYLKGGEGGLQIEVNSRGQQVRLLSVKEPTKGQDITLTIDSNIQAMAMASMEGKTGAIIVMDMDNGEILGMTSVPSYDPGVFIDAGRQKQRSELFSNPSAPLLNRAIKGLFPPGSIVKVAVAVGALDNRKITPHTTFHCRGYYELGGRRFGCTHQHGPQNLIEAMAHSCNVYFYHLGSLLGADALYQYYENFGLGQLTYIDLPYEERGNVPNQRKKYQKHRQQWYAGDTLNFSIGQGDILVTPLQLVRMMATIAASGVEVQPHVIKAIADIPVEQHNFKRVIPIDPQALKEVQNGMRAAVKDYAGTAHVLHMDQLYVAGKTGTAQSSGEQEPHAWFVGYVRSAKRNIVFCVFLEHGGSSHNACLVAKDLLLKMKEAEIL